MSKVNCSYCTKELDRKPSQIKKSRCHYCDKQCRAFGLRLNRMQEIEDKFGKPIHALLEDLYHNKQLGIKQISRRIGVSDRNLWDWFNDLGIERRSKSAAVANQWENNDARRDEASSFMRHLQSSGAIDNFGDNNPSKRPEVREKISESKKGERNPMYGVTGPDNPLWRGGKIPIEKYGSEWRKIRKAIKKRDGYACQICDSSKNLNTHHIVPFRDGGDHSPDNLVTLCASCHSKVHANSLEYTPRKTD